MIVESSEEFERLPADKRGFIVYLLGAREDEPYVPGERNPYDPDSEDYTLWEWGYQQAIILSQDTP